MPILFSTVLDYENNYTQHRWRFSLRVLEVEDDRSFNNKKQQNLSTRSGEGAAARVLVVSHACFWCRHGALLPIQSNRGRSPAPHFLYAITYVASNLHKSHHWGQLAPRGSQTRNNTNSIAALVFPRVLQVAATRPVDTALHYCPG